MKRVEMSNRYVTTAEIEGARRRDRAYRQRLKEAGIKLYGFLLTSAEATIFRQVISYLRGKRHLLDEQKQQAADILFKGEQK